MAFPSSTGSRKALARTLTAIEGIATAVKQTAQDLRTRSAAGNITARSVVQVMDELAGLNTRLDELKAVPGLREYAQAQYGEAQLDIAAEFTAMQAALTATVSWIQTNIPKDAGGRWLAVEEAVNGRRVDRLLAPATTAGLRTALDSLLATID